MGKYNLTSLLEIVNSSRVGTVRHNFMELQDIVDRLNDEDTAYVREDYDADEFGKVNYEARVQYGDGKNDFFTVYDYKFGYNPTDEEHADEEQNWSLGAPEETRDEGIRKAEQFGFDVVRKGRLEEKAHDKVETQKMTNKDWKKIKKFNKHVTDSGDKFVVSYDDRIGTFLEPVEIVNDYEDIMPAFSDDAGPRESNINEYDLYKELEKIKNKISK